MTKGEAKALETDVVIFPMEFGRNNQDEVLIKEATAADQIVENKPATIDNLIRFERLKKSLRKRSASIL